MSAISIRDFEYCHGIIVLEDQTIIYRAYDVTKPVLTEYPMFFGDIEVAHFYAKNSANRKIGEFRCKRQIRLLDMRYVMSILPYLLRKDYTHSIITKATLALGLCSFNKQIELLEELSVVEYPQLSTHITRMRDFADLPETDKPDWINPIELKGVRIGITDIDYEVMVWLKDIFKPIFNGIIAPLFPTPFHDQRDANVAKSHLMGEVILFNPEKVVTHALDRPLTHLVMYFNNTNTMQSIIDAKFHNMLTRGQQNVQPIRSYQFGGECCRNSINKLPLIRDTMGDRLSTDKKFRDNFNKARKTWMPIVKSIRNSQQYLQQACIQVCTVQPETHPY